MITIRRLTFVIILGMWILIGAGSLVTTMGAGLSIPDWPLAFHRFIPPHWHQGVVMEYGHRVIAGVLILATLALVITAWRSDLNRKYRRIPILILVLILVQALLGGLTVLLDLPRLVSIAHALVAQVTLLSAVFFWVLIKFSFTETVYEGHLHRLMRPLYPWAITVTVLVFLQVLLGIITRHYSAGLAVPDFPLAYGHLWPPNTYMSIPYLKPRIWVHMIHRYLGIIVAVFTVALTLISVRRYPNVKSLTYLARTTFALVFLQILLGGWIVWSSRHWLPTTFHVMTGTAITGLFLWFSFELFRIEHEGIL